MAKINEEHIITIDGKPFVKYAGLLEAVHRAGLKDLQVKLIQSPNRDNGYTAICEATATIKTRSREKVYVEIGDANPISIGDARLNPHAIRIAATRAKARALRDALCVSICSVEELGMGNAETEGQVDSDTSATVSSANKATEPQLRVLRMQADQLGLGDEEYARFSSMTKRQASETITELNKRINTTRVG